MTLRSQSGRRQAVDRRRRPGAELAVLAALVAVVLAACGAPAPTQTQPAVRPTVTIPPGLPVVIALLGRFEDPALAVLDRQIAAFEAANPGIRVEVVQAARTAAERRAEVAGYFERDDSSVDLLALDYQWLPELAQAGRLVALDAGLQAAGVDLEAFLPAAIEAGTAGDWLAGLPWTLDAGLLFYRRDLLAASGQAVPASWPEIERVALEMKDQAGLRTGLVWQGAPYETLTCNTLELVWAQGGRVLDGAGRPALDSPEVRAGLEQMLSMISSGASPPEVVSYRENEALNVFRQGEAGLMRNWAYAWWRLNAPDSPVAGQVGVAPLPAACLGGRALAVSALSLHRPEALRLAAFLSGYEQQVQWAEQAGELPALAAAYQAPELAGQDPGWAELYAALAAARPRPQTAAYARLSPIIYTQVHGMLAGQPKAGAAAATAQEMQRQAERLDRP